MKPTVHAVLSLTFVLALIGLLTGAVVAADIPRITKEELRAKLGDPSIMILDLRSVRDWKASTLKIRGAIREDPTDLDSWVGKYAKDTILVLYCA